MQTPKLTHWRAWSYCLSSCGTGSALDPMYQPSSLGLQARGSLLPMHLLPGQSSQTHGYVVDLGVLTKDDIQGQVLTHVRVKDLKCAVGRGSLATQRFVQPLCRDYGEVGLA